MPTELDAISVLPTATVREAIAAIGRSGRQIALVVDEAGHLSGVVTDGDVRRGILDGVELEAAVSEIMNAEPLLLRPEGDEDELVATMERLGIRQVPVLDADGRVTELFSQKRLLHPASTPTPVVLMAGGRGQRLYPLTKDVPKPMLPVGGVPLIEIILRNLAAQGFTNVFISVNYLADQIIDHIGDGSRLGLTVEYLHEEKPLGTAGALAALNGRIHHPLVVMNSDLLTQVDVRRMLRFHAKEGSAATVGVREHAFEIPYGVVNLSGSTVESMVEKPMHRSLVNAGMYVLDPLALELLQPEEYADMPTLLSRIMETGRSVSAFPIHEPWLDVGRPEDLDRARTSAEWANP
ncbi:MAG: nucleotidyltransferase family protein [Pseudolysinimonas sp.]